jgi:hypothetical protein
LKAAVEPTHPKALVVDQYARAREVQADRSADDIITAIDRVLLKKSKIEQPGKPRERRCSSIEEGSD